MVCGSRYRGGIHGLARCHREHVGEAANDLNIDAFLCLCRRYQDRVDQRAQLGRRDLLGFGIIHRLRQVAHHGAIAFGDLRMERHDGQADQVVEFALQSFALCRRAGES